MKAGEIVYDAICRNHRIMLNATMRNDQFEVEKILLSAFARAHSEIQGGKTSETARVNKSAESRPELFKWWFTIHRINHNPVDNFIRFWWYISAGY